MQVSLTQTEGLKFEATTARGVKFALDPKNHISPLEYFAIGAISCSATDIVLLPAKQGKTVNHLEVVGEFERPDEIPTRFTKIHVKYSFHSDGSDLDAKRWVLSSLESYCTTLNTVRPVAKIYYSITHNGKAIADKESIVSGESNSRGINAENIDFGNACAA